MPLKNMAASFSDLDELEDEADADTAANGVGSHDSTNSSQGTLHVHLPQPQGPFQQIHPPVGGIALGTGSSFQALPRVSSTPRVYSRDNLYLMSDMDQLYNPSSQGESVPEHLRQTFSSSSVGLPSTASRLNLLGSSDDFSKYFPN
jgi:hypothetical protein